MYGVKYRKSWTLVLWTVGPFAHNYLHVSTFLPMRTAFYQGFLECDISYVLWSSGLGVIFATMTWRIEFSFISYILLQFNWDTALTFVLTSWLSGSFSFFQGKSEAFFFFPHYCTTRFISVEDIAGRKSWANKWRKVLKSSIKTFPAFICIFFCSPNLGYAILVDVYNLVAFVIKKCLKKHRGSLCFVFKFSYFCVNIRVNLVSSQHKPELRAHLTARLF